MRACDLSAAVAKLELAAQVLAPRCPRRGRVLERPDLPRV